jgi:hypothetical protein
LGGELLALDHELKIEGKRYISILQAVGISRWRATIKPLPKSPLQL